MGRMRLDFPERDSSGRYRLCMCVCAHACVLSEWLTWLTQSLPPGRTSNRNVFSIRRLSEGDKPGSVIVSLADTQPCSY